MRTNEIKMAAPILDVVAIQWIKTGVITMHIVIFENAFWTEGYFSRLQKVYATALVQDHLNLSNVASYSDAEVISTDVSPISDVLLEHLPKLKHIACRGSGVDQIDLGACVRRRISVSCVPGYAETVVAEHTLALLFAVSRKIPQAVERTRNHDFSIQGLLGLNLAGKTLGIIGTGAIGKRVARMAKGLDMEVLAFARRPDPAWAGQNDIRYADFEEVLSQADILSLHIPGGPENRHLLSDQAFAGMKQGVLLINTARGDLIDNKALLAALEAGTIGGAGLDVLPEEALPLQALEKPEFSIDDPVKADIIQDNLRLLAHPRVIVTPHCGFFSREGVQALLETTEDNILAFCRSAPQNIVS